MRTKVQVWMQLMASTQYPFSPADNDHSHKAARTQPWPVRHLIADTVHWLISVKAEGHTASRAPLALILRTQSLRPTHHQQQNNLNIRSSCSPYLSLHSLSIQWNWQQKGVMALVGIQENLMAMIVYVEWTPLPVMTDWDNLPVTWLGSLVEVFFSRTHQLVIFQIWKYAKKFSANVCKQISPVTMCAQFFAMFWKSMFEEF